MWVYVMGIIGRNKELDTLQKIYEQSGFQMVVMYGRRRSGKTTLLNEFVKKKRNIFFTATRSLDDTNLSELTQAVMIDQGVNGVAISFDNYMDAFHYITTITNDEKLVVVIDEYPYLIETVSGISSILQIVIDREWLNRNIMLILCGSSISMMEDEVLSAKSPLFGRRTAQMDIRPFDYYVSAEFVPDYSPEDKAISYGITGGIPKYLSMIDPEKSMDQNIEDLFFDDSGYFFEEPENMLQQEFRNVASYNTLLATIAGGAVTISEMSQKTHLDSSRVTQMIHSLIRIRLVRRDVPVPDSGNKRDIRYMLCDGMFRFWYRYVSKAVNYIERGNGADYYRHIVKPVIHDYMGLEFEKISQEYMWRHALEISDELFITDIGKWRGTDNEKKEPADIDVVCIDSSSRKCMIGECKFRNEKTGRSEFELLKDRARLVRPYEVKKYFLFSLSGFTDEIEKETDAVCVKLDDMYRK